MWVSRVSSVLVFQPRPLSDSFTLKIAVQCSVHVGKHSPPFTDEAFAIGHSHLHSLMWIPSGWSPALEIAVQIIGAESTGVVIHFCLAIPSDLSWLFAICDIAMHSRLIDR